MLHGLARLRRLGANPERSVLLFQIIDLHICLARARQTVAAIHVPAMPRTNNALAVETTTPQRTARMKAMAAHRSELAVNARQRHGHAAEADFLQLRLFQFLNGADAVPVIRCRAHG